MIKKRFIKGSPEAKIFMQQIRNKKSNIGAAGDYSKYEISTIKVLSKLLKKSVKETQKLVNSSDHLLDIISNAFDKKLSHSAAAKMLKDAISPKVIKTPLEAFVQVLKKGSKSGSNKTSSKSNFPFKLPAMVTIGGLKKEDIAKTVEKLNSLYFEIEKFKQQKRSVKEFTEKLKLQKHINQISKQRRSLKQYLNTLIK